VIERRQDTTRNSVEFNECKERFDLELREFSKRDKKAVDTYLLRLSGISRSRAALLTGCKRESTVSERVARVREYLRVALRDFL